MPSGELIVVGKDEARITLTHFPVRVKVEFQDEYMIVPCNPAHHDKLEWEVERVSHHYVLIIKWKVSSVREILWTVLY